jgi:hypothetical protein
MWVLFCVFLCVGLGWAWSRVLHTCVYVCVGLRWVDVGETNVCVCVERERERERETVVTVWSQCGGRAAVSAI